MWKTNPTKYIRYLLCVAILLQKNPAVFCEFLSNRYFWKKSTVTDMRVTCPNIFKQKLRLFANFATLLARMIQDNKTLVMEPNCNINQITLKYSTEVHSCLGKHIFKETVHAMAIYVNIWFNYDCLSWTQSVVDLHSKILNGHPLTQFSLFSCSSEKIYLNNRLKPALGLAPHLWEILEPPL